ncbi:MAG: nucleoside hydrolase [Oscillospiraceae bacterium]|jgi:purine nucleosidase
MPDRRRVMIDTDTGSDDAVALVMALRDPTLEVVAISTIAGNVDLDKATINALTTCDYAGTYLPPVYSGAGKPMAAELVDAGGVHGKDGMGDLGTLRWSTRKPEAETGPAAIAEWCSRGVELICLGPLTNVAVAMTKDPDKMKNCPHITIMGGQVRNGNVGQVAEFNIWQDPEAADIVFGFGVPMTVLPIEACFGDARVMEDEVEEWRRTGTEWGRFCADINGVLMSVVSKGQKEKYITMPDPTAVAVVARPDLVKKSFGSYTRVETRGTITRGALVNDRRNEHSFEALSKETVLHPYNCTIVEEIDGRGFKDYILSMLS